MEEEYVARKKIIGVGALGERVIRRQILRMTQELCKRLGYKPVQKACTEAEGYICSVASKRIIILDQNKENGKFKGEF